MGRKVCEEDNNDVLNQPKKKTRQAIVPTSVFDASFTDDEALPSGLILTDLNQKKWRIGKAIGRGSFGRIYLATDIIEQEATKQNARYIVKIEPHTNGPLFVEVHCLIRTARAQLVKQWRDKHRLQRLGMPVYIGSGSFVDDSTDTRYRFLILPRYETDLQRIVTVKGPCLDLKNVLILAVQILDVLEYIHEKGYTHSDIKSSNLMVGFNGANARSCSDEKKVFKEPLMVQKTIRSPKSNYYKDDDYTTSRGLNKGRKNLKTFFNDRERRPTYRQHAFNLRQLSNYVNYEEIASSVCSDQSYQNLIDDSYATETSETCESRLGYSETTGIYEEAILSQSSGQVYLLDFGLASKFVNADGSHKEFGVDQRRAHDGTLKYSSRDSHIGAHSRRSDLETLAFNLLDWLTCSLPWNNPEMLSAPDLVHALKKNYMSDIKLLLKSCFKTQTYPEFMEKFLEYVARLDFTEKPDYNHCRKLFKMEFAKKFAGEKMFLNFSEGMSPQRKLNYSKKLGRSPKSLGAYKIYGRENRQSFENHLKLELLKKTLNLSTEGVRKPCASRNFFISDTDLVAKLKQSLLPLENLSKKLSPKVLRSKKPIIKKKGKKNRKNNIGKFGQFMGQKRQFTWAEILASNPENIIRKDKSEGDEDNSRTRNRKYSSDSSGNDIPSPLLQRDYLNHLNPTYAMKEVYANFKRRQQGRIIKEVTDHIEGYTPIMVKLFRSKEKREAKERLAEMVDIVDVVKRRSHLTRNRCKKTAKPILVVAIEKISSPKLRKLSKMPDEDACVKKKTAKRDVMQKSEPKTSETKKKLSSRISAPKAVPTSGRVLRSAKLVTRSCKKK